MENQPDPDIIKVAISGVVAVNPLVGYLLYFGWNLILSEKVTEMSGKFGVKLKDFEENVGERKYARWVGKVAGAFSQILPEAPKTQKKAHEFLDKLSKEDIRNMDQSLKDFFNGGNTEEFLDNLKEKFGNDSSSEALKFLVEIKNLIINKEILQEFNEFSNLEKENKIKLEKQLNELSKKFEANLKQLERNLLSLDEGFYIITPIYFEYHKSRGINNWIEGWKFRLIDVFSDLDYQRKIVNEIENEGNILISGESGYSKSTTLYRIICDYYNMGYSIVTNIEEFGGSNIEHPQKIVEVIEDLLEEGKVLVAVDDIQNKLGAFKIVSYLENHTDYDKIKFVFTARLPEFNEIRKGEKKFLNDFWEDIDYCLEKLMVEKRIENFDLEEAESFVKKYYPYIHDVEIKELAAKQYSKKIHKDSNGHPILFKYFLTRDGIKKDIERKYSDYIMDKDVGKEDKSKLDGTLFSCILNFCEIPITVDLTNKCKFNLTPLKDSILKYNDLTATWETIHPIWDKEFLIFWKDISKNPNESIREILDTIFNLKDKKITTGLIFGLTRLILEAECLFDLFEPSIKIPDYLDDLSKVVIYLLVLSPLYISKDPEKSLDLMDKGLNLIKRFKDKDFEISLTSFAWAMKGDIIYNRGKYPEALKLYDKALEINENNKVALVGKGNSFYMLKDYEKALEFYEKALKLDQNWINALVGKGNCFYRLGNYPEALEFYEKTLKNDSKFVLALTGIGNTYYMLGDFEKALEFYDKALDIDPEHEIAMFYKKIILNRH